jgi:tetratricopeptide (TPR) repeat protein
MDAAGDAGFRAGGGRDWLWAAGCGLVAFVVYAITLSPGVYPGQSAQMMAIATGSEPLVAPVYPLWKPVIFWLSGLSWLSLPVRLNLFSAVCGALAVMLTCRLVSFLVRLVVDDDSIEPRQAARAAVLAGVVAALALAFAIPCWSAATRLQVQSFDLLLLLAVFSLLAAYVRTGWLVLLFLFVALYGAGAVESVQFILMAPGALVAVLLALWRHERLTKFPVAACGLLLLAGLAVYVLVAQQFFRAEDVALRGYTRWQDVLVYMWRDQFHEIQRSIPRLNWFWLLLQGALPAAAVALAARRTLNNERSWSLYLLHLILTGVTACVLVNAPWSPWRLVAPQGVLPVLTYALVACVAGYLAAYWYLMASVAGMRHDQDLSRLTLLSGRWFGRILLGPLVILVVAAALVNRTEADGRRGRGADVCAGEILSRLGARTWIVTDGMLDPHLVVLARVRNQKIHLISLPRDTDKVYQRLVARALEAENLFPSNRTQVLHTLDLGILPFLQDWMASDPEIDRKLVISSVPDLWYGAGFTPVPELFFFSGKRDSSALDAGAWVADHLALWGRMEKVIPRTEKPAEPMAVFNNQLRRQMGFVGNNLGVILEEVGRTNDAELVYQRVRQLDPDNISVLFNRFELARRSGDAARQASAEQDVKDHLAREKRQYALYALSRHFGYVRSPELFARLGWQWAISGQPGAGLAGLRKAGDLLPQASQAAVEQSMAAVYMLQDERSKSEEVYQGILAKDPGNRLAMRGLAHLAMREGNMENARTWLIRLQKTGVAQNQLGIEWASIHLVLGEAALAATNLTAATAALAQARIHVQETTDLQPDNLQAWGMLAMVQMQQAGLERRARRDPAVLFREVEQTLTRMEKVAGSPDQYFIQIVKAQLAMARGPEYRRAAREFYIRAAMLRPDVVKLQDVVLQLDVALADRALAERHAQEVLRRNRQHALANYVIGSLRLKAGDYVAAEDFLRRSVQTEPIPAALNDLSEVLRRARRLPEAESFARQATVKAPALYVAWETLGAILLEQNRLAEAETALLEAVRINPEDARMQVSLARLWLAKGELERARESIRLARRNLDAFSDYERAEFETLAATVAARKP